MDTLVTILIFAAITVLSAWVRKKQHAEQTEDSAPDEHAPPASPQPPTQRPWANLEEELRRLLQGDEPAPPPKPPPPLPRTARVEPPAPAPARRVAPPVLPPPKPATPSRPQLQPRRTTEPRPVRPVAPAPVAPSPLAGAAQAQQRAAELDAQAAEKVRMAALRLKLPSTQLRKRSAVADRAQALLHDRASLRAVMVTSLILGTPRALQPPSSW